MKGEAGKSQLKWIEADFPQTMEFKDERLKKEKPKCHLERAKVDLSDAAARKSLLTEINSRSQKVLVITDYIAPELMKNFVHGQLKKAPFRFFPEDWESFFKVRGWTKKEMSYLGDEGAKYGRPCPVEAIANKIGFALLAKQAT